MNLHETHIDLIRKVNKSKTVKEHELNQKYLSGWRDGVHATGQQLGYWLCDMHYLNQGIDRPMCVGVFLDWKPEDEE